MWFRAKLLYQAVYTDETPGASRDSAPEGDRMETEVFITVDTPDEAQQAAADVGRHNERWSVTPLGTQVRWSFIGVSELTSWDRSGFPDGARIYSHLANEVPPLETLRHIGVAHFFDTGRSEESREVAHLRTLLQSDTESAALARRDFDLVLNGTLPDQEVLSIVTDSFNRSVWSREAAELYLINLREALFGSEPEL